MDARSDAELVRAYLKENDEDALTQLIQKYLKAVYNFLLRSGCRPSEAEDLVQDAFVKAWLKLKTYDQTKSFKTWLFTIAKNTFLDTFKKKRPLLFSDMEEGEDGTRFVDDIADDAVLPDQLMQSAETAKILEQALDALSSKNRMVMQLHYAEGLTLAEAAEVLGEPVDTVKSRHRRALMKIREQLERGRDLR